MEIHAGRGDEVALDLLGLALAEQPVVDEDAVQALADRTLHDGRGDGGVDTAGEAADGQPGLADLLADPLDLLLGDVEHRPGLAGAGDVVEEVLEHLLAVLGVEHLGVPLHAGQPAADVLEGGDRGVVGGGQDREALGRLRHRVAVGHPHLVLGGDALEEGARLGDGDGRAAVLRAPVWATSPPRPLAISWKP